MLGIRLETFEHPSIFTLDGKYWFQEKSDVFPGQTFGLQVEKILHHVKSPFQDILVFKSTSFGNVLVLNGIIQCTEKDEFAYQELISHIPVMSHPNPKRVLVIGGGDCGVVRELVKQLDHGVSQITMVEIDDLVIELAAKYLPDMAKHRNHSRVNIVIDDGFKYLKSLEANSSEKFDIIITDSSDPEGPAEEFFQANYFKLLQNALVPNGIVIMQSSENIWLNLDYLKDLKQKAQSVFANVEYCQCYMPSYTSGQLGLFVATDDKSKDLKKPLRTYLPQEESKLFRYYNSSVHIASFMLPTWAANTLT